MHYALLEKEESLCFGINTIKHIPVKVLAIVKPYAMVRKKGAYPFVCELKKLTKVSKDIYDKKSK